MTRTRKVILGIGIIVLLGIATFVLLKKYYFEPTIANEPITTTNTPHVIVENPTTTSQNLKTYRNEEWGFEFEYPSEMTVNEKVFGSYYSKFNIILFKIIGESHDWAVLVNIVLPKFVDTAFWKSQENTSKIIVDGVEGIKYEYEYDGSQYLSVILPFGEYKIILGTGDGGKPYIEELNQILSSFRFIKK